MNKKLQKYLIEKFPSLYTTDGRTDKVLQNIQKLKIKSDIEVSKNESLEKDGFQCNDGWFRLILWLSRYLNAYTQIQNHYASIQPEKYRPVDPIKVKKVIKQDGILRYVTTGGNEHTTAVIQFACYMSGFVCEKSGAVDDIGVNKTPPIKTHHVQFSNPTDFTYVDDDELRTILSLDGQLELDLNIK